MKLVEQQNYVHKVTGSIWIAGLKEDPMTVRIAISAFFLPATDHIFFDYYVQNLSHIEKDVQAVLLWWLCLLLLLALLYCWWAV